MKARDLKRVRNLLKYEETDKRCSLGKLSECLDNFMLSPYFDLSSFERGNTSHVISQIMAIQDKEELFEEMCEKIRKGKKYKDFARDYNKPLSGYSMGDLSEVIITDGKSIRHDIIADTRQKYTGKARRFNRGIKYGYYCLRCTISQLSKVKYELILCEKD